MAEKIVLRFQYVGDDIDIVVDDVDKVNLLDLVVEYMNIVDSKNLNKPRYPSFAYLHKTKHFDLLTDGDLMTMFNNLPGSKLIYIWVGSVVKPTELYESAMSLRAFQNEKGVVNEAIIGDNLGQQSCQNFIGDGGNMGESRWSYLKISPVKTNLGRGRGGGRLRGRGSNIGRDLFKGRWVSDITHNGVPILIEDYPSPNKSTKGSQPSTQTTLSILPPIVLTHDIAEQNITTQPTQIIQPPITNDAIEVHNSNSDKSMTLGEGVRGSVNLMKGATRKRVPRTTVKRKGLLGTVNEGVVNDTSIVSLASDNDLNREPLFEFEDGTHQHQDDSSDSEIEGSDSDDDREDDETDLEDCGVVNDYWDPDEGEKWEDEDDVIPKRLYKKGEMYVDEGFGNIIIKPRQLFTDKKHLRDVVRDYCIQSGFAIVVQKANNKKWTVICSDVNCDWRLHACRLSDGLTWVIKSIQNSEHSCLGLEIRNPMVNAKWAARVLLDDIRANNDIPASALNELLWTRFGVRMAISTLYRVRSRALVEIHGGFDESYANLPKYCEMIKITNPDSIVSCTWNSPQHPEKPLAFTSIFISFKACVDGLFSGCRSLIGVDGCHLKGNYGRVLLAAVALDGNDEIFPVAWAIVSSENEESWKFFVHHLKKLLQPSGRGDQWCFILDRQKVCS